MTWPSLLPRAVWTWTAPPPEGRRVQVWHTPDGQPLEFDIDLSDLTAPELAGGSGPAALPTELEFDFRPIVVPRVTTPTMDAVTLAALLVECER